LKQLEQKVLDQNSTNQINKIQLLENNTDPRDIFANKVTAEGMNLQDIGINEANNSISKHSDKRDDEMNDNSSIKSENNFIWYKIFGADVTLEKLKKISQ